MGRLSTKRQLAINRAIGIPLFIGNGERMAAEPEPVAAAIRAGVLRNIYNAPKRLLEGARAALAGWL